MPDNATAEYTAQLESAYKRNVQPVLRNYQKELRIAQPATITITEHAANDTITLGSLGIGGVVHPALCRLVGLSGSVAGVFKLQKVSPEGTVTDLTGNATLATDGTEVAFARASGGLKSFDADDVIRLIIVTDTDVAANDTIELQLAYSAAEAL